MRFEAQTSSAKIVVFFATLVGLSASFWVARSIGYGDYMVVIVMSAVVCGLLWMIGGSRIWWFPIFFLPALGGLFYVGFKIYVHELAVLICLAPLALALATNKFGLHIRQSTIQGVLLLLLVYLCLHLLGCLIYNKLQGLGGTGNILRRYADALWPLLFLLPFLWLGTTKLIGWSLHLLLAGYLIRYAIAYYAGISGREESMFIPIINYAPPSGGSIGDLRSIGGMLACLGIIYMCLAKGNFMRIFSLLLILMGCWGTLLGGNRMSLISLFLLFIYACWVYRKLALLVVIGGVLLCAIFFINANPEILYKLPDTARRSSSGLLLDRQAGADTGETSPSDRWHMRLIEEGWKNWTEDAVSLFVGRGTRPFEERAWNSGSGDEKFENMIEMATATGRYEKGLWDTLCTFGLFGFALYLLVLGTVIRTCAKAVFKYKISNAALGLAFLASYQCISWLLLCWIAGGFPSYPIMLGLIAKVALDDWQASQTPPVLSNASSPGAIPLERPLVSQSAI